LSLLPITLLMWGLSRRFGALSDRIGPRLLMGLGPIVAGLGMVWMGRLNADVNYWTDLLPGVLVFGLGLSATVAPLTNTVLGAVPQHNAGVASGVNNQVARVAALLAIAGVGAVVAATFESELGREGVEPLSGGPPEIVDASVEAFQTGMAFAGGLVVLGGVMSLVGIVNPRREEREARAPLDEPGAVRIAQPCPHARRAVAARRAA
jgi:MFS family permease